MATQQSRLNYHIYGYIFQKAERFFQISPYVALGIRALFNHTENKQSQFYIFFLKVSQEIEKMCVGIWPKQDIIICFITKHCFPV